MDTCSALDSSLGLQSVQEQEKRGTRVHGRVTRETCIEREAQLCGALKVNS